MHCVVKHSGFLPPPKALKEQSNCFSRPVLGTQINSSKRDETPTDNPAVLNVSLGNKAGETPLLSRPIFYTIIISTFATYKSSNGLFRAFLSNKAAASHTCLLELQLTWHKPGFMWSITTWGRWLPKRTEQIQNISTVISERSTGQHWSGLSAKWPPRHGHLYPVSKLGTRALLFSTSNPSGLQTPQVSNTSR